jgi:hypothetical protein
MSCLNYGTSNQKLNNNISINYNNFSRYQYWRITPDYFRYVPPDAQYTSYRNEILEGTGATAACLREQLVYGPIILWTLEEMYFKLVPSVEDDEETTNYKDKIRNEFIAFCLNIEKTYIFYNKGRKTCNNTYVPWGAIYTLNKLFENPSIGTDFAPLYASSVPLSQLDQTIIYKLALNYFKGGKINYTNIVKKSFGESVEETEINFYAMIYLGFVILQDLFHISETLLVGKNTGLPKKFVDKFFPPSRQKYYFNLYMSWLQSRNGYFGFENPINVSNGDGTYIRIP